MKECSDLFAYSLARIRWDVFTGLSIAGRIPRPSVLYGHAWRHLHQAAELTGRPYSQLLIALRAELGEKTGRFHFHYLLGGTETRNVITLCHQLERAWKVQTGAISDIRPYDHSQAGVKYITKCLTGADVYEMNKFDLANEVTLSRSVYRVIRSLDRIGKDTQLALAKKRAAAEAAS